MPLQAEQPGQTFYPSFPAPVAGGEGQDSCPSAGGLSHSGCQPSTFWPLDGAVVQETRIGTGS